MADTSHTYLNWKLRKVVVVEVELFNYLPALSNPLRQLLQLIVVAVELDQLVPVGSTAHIHIYMHTCAQVEHSPTSMKQQAKYLLGRD
jgi:hypothetical protein